MSGILPGRLAQLKPYAGECNKLKDQVKVISPEASYTYEFIANVQDTCYKGQGLFEFHMSNIEGETCIARESKVASRVRADCIDEKCVEANKNIEGAKVLCDALYETLDEYAEPPPVFSWQGVRHYGRDVLTWLAIGVPGSILAGWGFHAGYDLWQRMKGGPKPPPGGSGPGAKIVRIEDYYVSTDPKDGRMMRDTEPTYIPMPKPEQVAEVGFWAAAALLLYKVAQGTWHILNAPAPVPMMFIIVPPGMEKDSGFGTGCNPQDPTSCGA